MRLPSPLPARQIVFLFLGKAEIALDLVCGQPIVNESVYQFFPEILQH